MPGANAATSWYAARTLLAKSVEGGGVEIRGRAEPRDPAIVDEHLDVTHPLGEILDRLGVPEVRSHEGRRAAGVLDRSDGLGPAMGVAALDDDVEPLRGQADGRSAADAGGGSRDASDGGACGSALGVQL